LLAENEILDHECIDVGCHETAIGISRRTDDGFAPDIERSIDQERAAGFVAKLRDELVVAPMTLRIHGLYPRRVVDVSDGRNRRAMNLELVETLQRARTAVDLTSVRLLHGSDQEHVGTLLAHTH